MYWELSPPPTSGYAMWYKPPSNAVEATAYGLLTYVLKKDYAKGALIVKWLSTQRTSYGGFGTTQVSVHIQTIVEINSM